MKRYVFDSYALLVLFRKESGYEKVIEVLEEVGSDKAEGFIAAVNIGEIYYITFRKQGRFKADMAVEAVKSLKLEIEDADLELSLKAANFKAQYKMSYADCFAAALALQKDAVLVTGDKEFKQLEKKIKIKWI